MNPAMRNLSRLNNHLDIRKLINHFRRMEKGTTPKMRNWGTRLSCSIFHIMGSLLKVCNTGIKIVPFHLVDERERVVGERAISISNLTPGKYRVPGIPEHLRFYSLYKLVLSKHVTINSQPPTPTSDTSTSHAHAYPARF